jgi:hypothetical protein
VTTVLIAWTVRIVLIVRTATPARSPTTALDARVVLVVPIVPIVRIVSGEPSPRMISWAAVLTHNQLYQLYQLQWPEKQTQRDKHP